MSCCLPSETPVVYDNAQGFSGTETSNLRIIGPENAVAEPAKCGAGLGAECCIFLTAGKDGFCCERYGDLRFTLIFKKSDMTAKREPLAPFPQCQIKSALR
jgi:hypothetical protein